MSQRSDILDAAQAAVCSADTYFGTIRYYGTPINFANAMLDRAGLLRCSGEEVIVLDDAYRAALLARVPKTAGWIRGSDGDYVQSMVPAGYGYS